MVGLGVLKALSRAEMRRRLSRVRDLRAVLHRWHRASSKVRVHPLTYGSPWSKIPVTVLIWENRKAEVCMPGRIHGKRVVIVVAQEFEDIELLYPILQLNYEGAEIVVVPVDEGLHPRPFIPGKPVTGRFGHTIPIPVMEEGKRYVVQCLDGIDVDETDCLLFPGGYSPDALRLNRDVLHLTRRCHSAGKIVAAICHGPLVLVSAGLVEGVKTCGYDAVHDDLVNAGAELLDVPAVRDGNIITGRVPDDLPEFCEEIVRALTNEHPRSHRK